MKRQVVFLQNNNSSKNPVVPILMAAFVALSVYLMGAQTTDIIKLNHQVQAEGIHQVEENMTDIPWFLEVKTVKIA